MTPTNLKNQKVDDDLQRAIREYKHGLIRRLRILTDVEDAVNAFCQETCVWHKYTDRAGNNSFVGECAWMSRRGWFNIVPTNCPHCGKRVVERFELIGDDQ